MEFCFWQLILRHYSIQFLDYSANIFFFWRNFFFFKFHFGQSAEDFWSKHAMLTLTIRCNVSCLYPSHIIHRLNMCCHNQTCAPCAEYVLRNLLNMDSHLKPMLHLLSILDNNVNATGKKRERIIVFVTEVAQSLLFQSLPLLAAGCHGNY